MKTALIIEDNEDNMELISFILEKNGFRTVQAVTGREGIDVCFEEKPDFILLDIQLPDMDGLDVLKEIRRSEIDGEIPIIAVTSYAMSGDREKLLEAGCNGYIEKPIDPANIISQLEKVIGGLGNSLSLIAD